MHAKGHCVGVRAPLSPALNKLAIWLLGCVASYLFGAIARAVEAAAQRASARAHDSANIYLRLADSLQEAGVAGKGKEAA